MAKLAEISWEKFTETLAIMWVYGQIGCLRQFIQLFLDVTNGQRPKARSLLGDGSLYSKSARANFLLCAKPCARRELLTSFLYSSKKRLWERCQAGTGGKR